MLPIRLHIPDKGPLTPLLRVGVDVWLLPINPTHIVKLAKQMDCGYCACKKFSAVETLPLGGYGGVDHV